MRGPRGRAYRRGPNRTPTIDFYNYYLNQVRDTASWAQLICGFGGGGAWNGFGVVEGEVVFRSLASKRRTRPSSSAEGGTRSVKLSPRPPPYCGLRLSIT